MSIKKIAYAAVIGAAYAALTMLLAPISYGPVQFRLAEALCVLPFFFPFSVWGLAVGCCISNLLSSYGVIDVVFGTLATLLAALCTMYIGKRSRGGIISKALACLPPVLANGVIIGGVIAWSTAPDAFYAAMLANGLTVALGELVVMYAIGLPLLALLPKTGVFRYISDRDI